MTGVVEAAIKRDPRFQGMFGLFLQVWIWLALMC